MADKLPRGAWWAGGWTDQQQQDLEDLRARRDAAPVGSAERQRLDRELYRAPDEESSGRRYAEGL